MDTSPLRFPLGENVYAYVKTWKGCTKIHIRHFAQPTNTKGGSVVASVKGVKMDLKMFNRLCKVKKKLADEFRIQKGSTNNNNNNNNKQKKQQQQQQQQQQQRSRQPTKKRRLGDNNNNNNNNAEFVQQVRTGLCVFGNYPKEISSLTEELVNINNNNDPSCNQCHCLSALTPKYPTLNNDKVLLPPLPTTSSTTPLPELPSSLETLCA